MFANPPVSNKKPLVSASSKLPDLASKSVIVSSVTAGLPLLSSPLNVFVNVPENAVMVGIPAKNVGTATEEFKPYGITPESDKN